MFIPVYHCHISVINDGVREMHWLQYSIAIIGSDIANLSVTILPVIQYYVGCFKSFNCTTQESYSVGSISSKLMGHPFWFQNRF